MRSVRVLSHRFHPRRGFWKFLFAVHMACGLCFLPGCGSSDGETPELNISTASTADNTPSAPAKPKYNPFPEVEVKTSLGEFTLKLNAEKAPLTVENFLYYVNHERYDGTIFHQVFNGFILLGGGYDAQFAERPMEMPIRNEAHNGLENRRGTIAMARPADGIDSATNLFFINLADNSSLDHAGMEPSQYGYCVFGEVIAGMDVIDRIAERPVHNTPEFENAPVEPVVIETMQRVK